MHFKRCHFPEGKRCFIKIPCRFKLRIPRDSLWNGEWWFLVKFGFITRKALVVADVAECRTTHFIKKSLTNEVELKLYNV